MDHQPPSPLHLQPGTETAAHWATIAEGRNDACVPEGFSFTGDLVCDERDRLLLIGGTVRGSVRSACPVIVLEGGVIEGSLRAPRVSISGRVTRITFADGIVVDGQLTLFATARIQCNAVYEDISAERGASLAGTFVPFKSEFFHELAAEGKLPFVEALEQLGRAVEKPVKPGVTEPNVEPTAGSMVRAPLHAVPSGDATSLRSLSIAEDAEGLGRPGVDAPVATGTHGQQ